MHTTVPCSVFLGYVVDVMVKVESPTDGDTGVFYVVGPVYCVVVDGEPVETRRLNLI